VVSRHVYTEVNKFHLGSTYQEPRILYHNNRNGTFTDISDSSGPGITTISSARGLAVCDLWNDGRISAVVSNISARPSLLVNQVRSPNHWIAIKTIGTKSNRDGIGARITVKVDERTLIDEVRSGSSTIPAATCGFILDWARPPRSDGYRFAGQVDDWNASTT
jgi:hypothetical protein